MDGSMQKPNRLPMLLSDLFPKNEEEKVWTGPFTFVHAADPQLGLIEKHILKKSNPRWNVDLIHLKCAIRMINEIRPKPRFFVIGGDMVDTPPYDDLLSTHIAQYEDLLKCLNELDPDIKLVCVCGNHDVGDIPTEMTMDVYRQEFGPEYFSFWHGGVKFTVLNSQYFKCPEALPMATFQQNDFLGRIKDESALHLVVFQHIPLFIEHQDEIDVSFLNINKSTRKDVLDQFTKAGVGYVFNGHTHRNGISSFGSSEQILTAAIGGTFDETKSGFRIVYVTESSLIHEYIPLDLQFKEKEDIEKYDWEQDKNTNQKHSDKLD